MSNQSNEPPSLLAQEVTAQGSAVKYTVLYTHKAVSGLNIYHLGMCQVS